MNVKGTTYAVIMLECQAAGNAEMGEPVALGAGRPSFVHLLKVHRELLVCKVRNTQCLIDNLIKNEYFSTEDAEIAAQYPTQADKVLASVHPKHIDNLSANLKLKAEYVLCLGSLLSSH